MAENAGKILHLLREMYPQAGPELNFANPYETLVATILSAQCTDARVNMVTPAVFRDFPTPAAMAATEPETLYPYIRSCGMRSKADYIVNSCRIICDRFGGQVPRTMEELTSLPGVGRKVASVVLMCAFNIPAMPVDTHVFRVSNRLGLANAKTPAETEKQLCALIPPQDWRDAHHQMIFHGRRVCHSQRPDCENCRLKDLCRFHAENTAE